MTTLNEARQLVYNRFLADWKDGADPLTPFCFDNETLDEPPLVWARCVVRSMPGGQSTLGAKGNRKYHRKGLARVEVYAEPGKGRDVADRLCEAAKTMFEGEALAGVKLTDAEIAEVGLVDDDRWDLSTVSVNFDYEEIK
jgi:hypothetical protein